MAFEPPAVRPTYIRDYRVPAVATEADIPAFLDWLRIQPEYKGGRVVGVLLQTRDTGALYRVTSQPALGTPGTLADYGLDRTPSGASLQAAVDIFLDGAEGFAAATQQLDGALDEAALASAEAFGVLGIAPAYISATTADPPAAPDGTRGAKRLADGSLQRLIRTGNAWVNEGEALLGRTAVDMTITARLVADTLATIKLAPGKVRGDIRQYQGRTYWWDDLRVNADDGVTILTPAGNPAMGRWVLADREWGWHINWFGGKGDGVTDDTAAFAAAAATGRMILESGAVYRVTSSTVIYGDVNIATTGRGLAVIRPTGAFPAFTAAGAISGAATTLATNTIPGRTSITLTDASGIVPGMLLKLTSTALWPYDHRGVAVKGELHGVLSVAGNVVTLSEPTYDSYNTATETVTVQAYAPAAFNLERLRVQYMMPQDTLAFSLNYTLDAVITGCQALNARTTGIGLIGCLNTAISGLKVKNANQTGYGYGVQDSGGYGTTIQASEFENCRRGVDFSGAYPARRGRVTGCKVSVSGNASDGSPMYDNSSGFGTHGPSEHIVFDNNEVFSVKIAFELRGLNTVVRGNALYGKVDTGVAIIAGRKADIIGNTYSRGTQGRSQSPGFSNLLNDSMTQFIFIQPADGSTSYDGLTVKGNVVDSSKYAIITTSVPLTNLQVTENTVRVESNSGANPIQFIKGLAAITLSGVVIERNKISAGTGVYSYFSSEVTVNWATCDIDQYPITSGLTVWPAGNGVLANVMTDLVLSVSGRRATLTGSLKFDVTSVAQIRLNALVAPKVGNQKWRFGRGDAIDNMSEGLLTLIINNAELYVSYETTAYSKQWPVGTGYVVPVDISYLRT